MRVVVMLSSTRVNHPLRWPVETQAEIRGLGRHEASGCSDRALPSNRPTTRHRSPHGRHPKASANLHHLDAINQKQQCSLPHAAHAGSVDPSIHPPHSQHAPPTTAHPSPARYRHYRGEASAGRRQPRAKRQNRRFLRGRQKAAYCFCCASVSFRSFGPPPAAGSLIAAATSAVKNQKLMGGGRRLSSPFYLPDKTRGGGGMGMGIPRVPVPSGPHPPAGDGSRHSRFAALCLSCLLPACCCSSPTLGFITCVRSSKGW
jgi:hypothetical protein